MISFKGIYLVTSADTLEEERFYSILEKALKGGISLVQLREKNASTREFLRRGRKIKKLLDSRKIPLIINDRVDIALALEASGVHLGQSDMPYREARKILGPGAIIGVSVESREQLEEAATCPDISYLGISAVFPSPTKIDTPHIWGFAGLREARKRTDLPLVAIGGISEQNASEVFAAGADMIALVSAIMESPDPEKTVKNLKNLHNRISGKGEIS
ncbi:MAG TPA: thiamine phosphate synthase [Synergistaceae bacterium]|nr:thiamine phosphate synthase [Synergistaceae bacterium]